MKDLGPILHPLKNDTIIKYISYWEPRFPRSYELNFLKTFMIVIGKLFANISLIFKALPIIKEFRPDIVHIHTPLQIGLGYVVKLFFKCPLIITYHGTDFNRLKKNKFLLKIINYFVDHTVCISEDIHSVLKELSDKKYLSYIPNGVDLNLFKFSNQKKNKQIISVGRLVWQKDYLNLLKAFSLFLNINSDYRLLIIGEGPEKKSILKEIKNLKIDKNVELVGLCTQAEIVEILNQSKFFVLSSISEGFPKSLIEAMACGLPCIVTDVGSCELIIEDSGVVVKPGDPNDLFHAMEKIKLLIDSEKYFYKKAIDVSKKYSWERRNYLIEKLYSSFK